MSNTVILRRGSDREANELMDTIADIIQSISQSKSAECKWCPYVAIGNTLGEILDDLGRHGEAVHKEDSKW